MPVRPTGSNHSPPKGYPVLSTKEFTAEELAQARAELAAMEVRSRYADSENAYVVLRSIGLSVVTAAEHHPDDASLRHAGAMYAAWRELPANDPERQKAFCGAEDLGDRYSRGDTEEPAVPIKPDTLLADLSDHHRDA